MDIERYNGSTDSTVTSVDVGKTVEVAEILRNSRRIQMILELESSGEGELSVGELADRIAVREYGPDPTPERRKTVYVALYHSQVPRMDTDSVIDYDRGMITRGSRFEEVATALARLQE